ncbi:hypothetical protein [Winogradskyella psychrotolerans]|uniref:hypothetical protein n=1 Tax=Winogradskyella psychrotolerans TaxID=1344585 RepID=UPI001C06C6B0|nr:hypothetical protein [Winogradskyella psychrotolerans]MBU2927140.1 hypothetical protein [Winogradskyella psychrotolerans]
MKKLIFIFCTFGLIFNSCSDDASETIDNPSSDGVFLKIIIETYEGEELITNFTYLDDKLIEVSDSDGYSEVFIYSNDVLTTIEEYQDDVLEAETELEYDSNNRLIKESYTYGSGSPQVNEFTYNSDGTITMDEAGINTYTYSYDVLGNRITEAHEEGDEDYSYTYDSNNNPFINIHQRNVFELLGRATYANNILSYINTSSAAFSDDFTSSYSYNASDYPTNGSTTYNQGSVDQEVVTFQFIYEL